jgi:hypothetical protein
MPADQKATQDSQSRGVFRQDISRIELASKRHPHCTVKPWHMRSVLRTTKSALAFLIAASALLGANRAMGQTGGTTGSGTGGTTGASLLAKSDFTYYLESYDPNQKSWVQMNTTQQQYYFNRARCECDGDITNYTGYFRIVIQPASATPTKIQTALSYNQVALGHGRLYAGNGISNCLTPSSYAYGLQGSCTNLLNPGNFTEEFALTVFESQRLYTSPPIPVAWLFGALSSPTTCGGTSPPSCDSITDCTRPLAAQNIYFWAQTTPNISPDFSDPALSPDLVGSLSYGPTNVTVEPGNEALNVKWSWPAGISPSGDSTFLGVQLFCQRGANTQVFPSKTFGQSFMTSGNTCSGIAPAPSTDEAFFNLDPDYLCSGLLPSTANSYRITGLQNGIPYGVGVVAIDKYYNVSAISSADVVPGTPIPTVDFYSEYKKLGGSAQGGFCAVASRRSRQSAALGICLAGLALMLVVRRRSRKSPPSIGPFVLVLATGTLLAGQARAQPVYHDSAFEEDRVSEAWGGSPRQYAIEARFGLYTPNLDSEFSKTTPQADVFGSKRRPMWQLEFDWEFLQEFGTLSLGGVIGYYKENAQSCQLTGLKPDGTCPVVANDPSSGPSGDNTALRLIPLAALLIYRMDEAANHWHIPLVPYAKIGLNYTIWTITNGNGDVAWFTDSKGHASKGQGGTMGWQAAVGLSLSLDFIDPGAARGFDADSGVNHTYAFFELDHIDGSGLYHKDVLRVGDDTWFAGLMFEF